MWFIRLKSLLWGIGTESNKAFMNIPGKREFCNRCKSIDLEDILSHPERIRPKYGVEVARLGEPGSWCLDKCPLCQLFYSTTRGREPGSIFDNYNLYAFTSPSCNEVGLNWNEFASEYSETVDATTPVLLRLESAESMKYYTRASERMLAAFPDKHLQEIPNQLPENLLINSLPGATDPVPSISDQSGIRFSTVKENVEFRILKAWLAFCQEEHDCYLHRTELKSGEELPLHFINCHARKVAFKNDGLRSKYAALSYVWGDSEGGDGRRCQNIFPSLPEELPNVISDAIDAARELGFQYLWVDKYCINQDDPDEKTRIINKMDLVYSYAEVTIIVAAGFDPTYGIPGVGRSRRSQLSIKVGKYILIPTLTDPITRIRASKWATRGWTYQEALLSPRRLIFTDDQAYFECCEFSCQEMVSSFPKWPRIYGQGEGILFRHPHQSKNIGLIKGQITHYSTLQLSRKYDRLNAILGTFRSYESMADPLYHYWGVPIDPDPKTGFNSRKSTVGFLHGLLWIVRRPCYRLKEFPSWTWLGWEGEVDWFIPVVGKLVPEPEICSMEIWVELAKGEKIHWEEFQAAIHSEDLKLRERWYTNGGNITHYLHIQAQFVKVRFEYLPEGPSESAAMANNAPGFYFRYSSNPLTYCSLLLSREAEEGGDFFQRLQMESWDSIIMATCESLPVLLVLDWIKEDTAERIGILSLAAHRRPGDEQAMVRSLQNKTPLEYPPPLDPPPLLKRMRKIRLQ